MNRLQERARPGRPRIHVALRSDQRDTEVRIRVSWCYRLSGPAAARLLVVAVLVLAAAAAVEPAAGELARGVLYGLAGFLAGARRGTGHDHYARKLPEPAPARACWRHGRGRRH